MPNTLQPCVVGWCCFAHRTSDHWTLYDGSAEAILGLAHSPEEKELPAPVRTERESTVQTTARQICGERSWSFPFNGLVILSF
jgi:hypothetical protein